MIAAGGLANGQQIAAAFALLVLPIAITAIFFLSQQATLFRSLRFELLAERAAQEMATGFSLLLGQQRLIEEAIDLRNSEQIAQILEEEQLEVNTNERKKCCFPQTQYCRQRPRVC